MLAPDIWKMIISFLPLRDKIRLKKVCKFFSQFEIVDFWNLGSLRSDEITIDLLKKYPKIKYLDLFDNKLVNDISFLTELEWLNIGGQCTISDISSLNKLTLLYAANNYRMTNLKNNSRIKKLNAVGACNIADKDISHLDLEELDCSRNEKITTTKSFRNLKKLIHKNNTKISHEELKYEPK